MACNFLCENTIKIVSINFMLALYNNFFCILHNCSHMPEINAVTGVYPRRSIPIKCSKHSEKR